MKAQDFLKFIESEKLVTKDVLKKLHHKVDTAGRSVSAQSVASYLINKKVIDREQATGWISRFQASQKEELVVNVAAERDSQNTMDLISMAGPPTSDKPVVTRDMKSSDEDDGEAGVEVLEETTPAPKPVTSKRKAKTVAVDNVDEVAEVVNLGHDQMVADADPLFDVNPAVVDPFAEQSSTDETGGKDEPATKYSFGRTKRNNQWVSKWPLIGSGVLLAFLVIAFVIWKYLFGIDAETAWENANRNYEDSNYSTAMRDYLFFIDNWPGDDRCSLGKVRVVNCELRIPYEGNDWDTVRSRALTRLPDVADEEDFSDLHEDLAVILPDTTEGFTMQGLNEVTIDGKQKFLKLTEEMMTLVERPDYIPTSQRKRDVVSNKIEAVDNNIKILKRQIAMEQDYEATLQEVTNLVKDNQTNNAFQAFRKLVQNYPEIESRLPLRDALRSISDKESELVSELNLDAQVTNADPESNIEKSIILATRTGAATELSEGAITYLVDGSIYAFSASDGAVLWRRFVGLPTLIQPQWLNDNRTDLISVDQRDNSVQRLSGKDGSLIWSSVIGTSFAEPVIDNNSIIITTFEGGVVKLNAEDGTILLGAKLPQPLEVGAAAAERDPYIYQPGSHSNLYVISKDDFSCREVVFLGHKPNMIRVKPFYISNHLLVAVNGNNYCNLHVFRPADGGLKLEEVQSPIRLDGRVTTPIFRYRRWAIVMTDRGDMRMLEVNMSDEETPVSSIAKVSSDFDADVTNYLFADENQVWVAGKGIVRYRIQKPNSTFERQKINNNLDVMIGQPQKIGDALFHVRRRRESSMVSVTAVNPETLEQIWRSDFSAPLASPMFVRDGKRYSMNAQGDLFPVDQNAIDTGISTQVMRASNQAQDLVFNQFVTLANGTYAAFGPPDRRSLVSIDFDKRVPANLVILEDSLTNPTCDAVAFGEMVLLATERGQVYRINPATGRSVGAPFQPALEPQVKLNWMRPVVLPSGTEFFLSDSNGRTFLVAAEGDTAMRKKAELTLDSPVVSPAVLLGENVALVARGENGDELTSLSVGNEIAISNEVELPGGLIDGPYQVDDQIVVLTDDGKMHCYDQQLQAKWSFEMPRDRLAGPPTYSAGQIVIAMESGLVTTVNSVNGETIDVLDVKQPLAGAPAMLDGQLFVSGTDGTIYLIAPNSN